MSSENSPESAPKLSIIDHVRLRPGMYWGGTGEEALHLLVRSLVVNSVNQVIKGVCDQIEVTLDDNNLIGIADNGEGIPIENYQNTERSTLEIIMTEAAGKHLDNKTKRFSATMFGTGLAAVNAVAEELTVEVKRNGYLWRQTYAKGKPTSELSKVRMLASEERTGTTITFRPDFTIFEQNDFDYETLKRRLMEWAFLVHGVTITLEDKRSSMQNETLHLSYSHGVADYVKHLNREYLMLHEPVVIETTIPLKLNYRPTGFDARFEIALQYIDSPETIILGFVNGFEVEQGGTHIRGFTEGIERAIGDYAYEIGMTNQQFYSFIEQDFISGLTAVISIWHPHPEFEGSIYRLKNPDLEETVFRLVWQSLEVISKHNPVVIQSIVKKCLNNKLIRTQRRFGRGTND